jgi:hypothetical protein
VAQTTIVGGTLEISLRGFLREVGGLQTAQDIAYRLGAPDVFTDQHLKTAQRDYEIVAEMIKDNPEKTRQVMNDVLRRNMESAAKGALELGLTEKQFIAKGGGFPIAIIIICIACALLLEHD